MALAKVAARLRDARVLVVGLVFLWVSSAWLRSVRADTSPYSTVGDSPSPASAQTPVVEVRVVGTEDSLMKLRLVLGNRTFGESPLLWSRADHFAPQQLLDLVPLSRVKIRCWIDLTDPKMAKLYFVAPKHDRFMVRELELMQRFGNFEVESIAQIVELSAQSLLRDAEAGMSRREVTDALAGHTPSDQAAKPPTPVPPNSLSPTRRGVGFGVRPTYGVTHYSGEISLHPGPGIGPYLFFEHTSRRDQLEVAISYALPRRVEHPVANAEIDRLEIRVGAHTAWPLGPTRRYFLGPQLNLALGSVAAHATPGDAPGAYQLNQSQRDVELGAGIGVRLGASWSPHLGADLSLDLQWIAAPVRHEFLVDGSPEALTTGKRFRPGLILGLRFE